MQDLPKELSESKALPFMRFFPAGKQGGVEIKLSGFNIQQTMKLIQDNASNKFDLPKYAHLSPHEISQQPLGSKITAEEVIEAENKKKEADKKRDSKYIKEDL